MPEEGAFPLLRPELAVAHRYAAVMAPFGVAARPVAIATIITAMVAPVAVLFAMFIAAVIAGAIAAIVLRGGGGGNTKPGNHEPGGDKVGQLHVLSFRPVDRA